MMLIMMDLDLCFVSLIGTMLESYNGEDHGIYNDVDHICQHATYEIIISW